MEVNSACMHCSAATVSFCNSVSLELRGVLYLGLKTDKNKQCETYV
jgi:hypothetical protein